MRAVPKSGCAMFGACRISPPAYTLSSPNGVYIVTFHRVFARMLHFFHVFVRILAGVAGLTLVYAAIFLYEDEQGKLQNRLEQWWVQVNDKQKAATSQYAVFMREVAKVAAGLFERLFGSRLFSLHAVRVSAAFSMGSYLLWMNFQGMRTEGLSVLLLLVAAAFFWYGSQRLTLRRPLSFLTHFIAIPLLVILFFGFSINYGNAGLAAVAGSFVCDFAFIAITRQTLRWCSRMESFVSVLLVVLINCLVALFLVIGPAALYYRDAGKTAYNPPPEWFARSNWILAGASLAGMNAVDALTASLFVILALVAIAHRVLWPLLGRALYALQGIGIARRRSLMASLGIALLTHGGVNLPDQLKKIVEKFSS